MLYIDVNKFYSLTEIDQKEPPKLTKREKKAKEYFNRNQSETKINSLTEKPDQGLFYQRRESNCLTERQPMHSYKSKERSSCNVNQKEEGITASMYFGRGWSNL